MVWAFKMELQNLYMQGQDNCPKTLAKALGILNGKIQDTGEKRGMWEERLSHKWGRKQLGKENVMPPVTLDTLYATVPTNPTATRIVQYTSTLTMYNAKGRDRPMGIGFIQVAFLQWYGYKFNLEHIYLDLCTTFSVQFSGEEGIPTYCTKGG